MTPDEADITTPTTAVVCPPGTSGPGCSPCPPETFQPAQGQTSCLAASQCTQAQYEALPPTETSDRVCELCTSDTNQGACAGSSSVASSSSSAATQAGAIAGSIAGVAGLALFLFALLKYWHRQNASANITTRLHLANASAPGASQGGAFQIDNPTCVAGGNQVADDEPRIVSVGAELTVAEQEV